LGLLAAAGAGGDPDQRPFCRAVSAARVNSMALLKRFESKARWIYRRPAFWIGPINDRFFKMMELTKVLQKRIR
jgi:hypothetical protein